VSLQLTRRRFAKVLAQGSLVAGFNALTGWVTFADERRGVPFDRLPPLDGTLSLDEATRRRYAQDYGQIIHRQPLAVLQPGSVEDLARMVRFARRFRLRIAARGQGHQPFGQAQVAGGVVIDMRSLRTDPIMADDRIEVDGGADWRSVVETALSYGRTTPVLPAYLGLTVGGTLSIGGVGTTTFRHGAQVDHVLELQVVTGEGEVVTCSPVKNRDLFEAALAGQGQVAIITRAVVRLVPAPINVREYVLKYRDLRTLLQDGARLAADGRFDGLVASISPSAGGWSYSLAAASFFTPPNTPDTSSLTSGLGHVSGTEQVNTVGYAQHVDAIRNVEFGSSHPDLGLSIPGSAAASFIGATLARLTPGDLGTVSAIRVHFWRRGPFTRPLFRTANEETSVCVVFQREEASDPSVVSRMLKGNRELFVRNRALGGTHYPFAALELSPGDWQKHYGSAWPALVRAKRRYDPDGVLASGPNLFRSADSGETDESSLVHVMRRKRISL
jgi:cytokinin dehydrogenase